MAWIRLSESTWEQPTAWWRLWKTASRASFVEDGKGILPSVVGLDEQGQLLIGEPAWNQVVLAPERTIASIKRKMGEDIKIPLGEQQYSPQEISAMILRKLKERAEKQLGQPGLEGGDHRAGVLQRNSARSHPRGRRTGGSGGRADHQRTDRRRPDLRTPRLEDGTPAGLRPGRRHIRRLDRADRARRGRGAGQPRRHAPGRRRFRQTAAGLCLRQLRQGARPRPAGFAAGQVSYVAGGRKRQEGPVV